MQIDEESLRRAFGTPFGAEVPGLMLSAVQAGVVFDVTANGESRHVPDREAVLALLSDTCGWTPESGSMKNDAAPAAQAPNLDQSGWTEFGWAELVSTHHLER